MSFKGKTYNSTWSYRKTADDVIVSVIDALEYIKRVQNWSENVIPLINTDSFDAVSALRPNMVGISRQILDYDRSSTRSLADEICKQFLLCCRQNENGEECVEDIITRQNPETIITYRDIIPGSISDIEEPDVYRIYCEPFINYGYDQATGKYKFYIRVTNTDKSTFDPSYVECNDVDNYIASQGETWWATCRALRLKYRQFNAMPDSQGNNDWINNYGAAADQFSMNIEWMTKQRVSFNLPYTTARKWYVGKHFMLQLPHQTKSQNLECVIESITKDKNRNSCTINSILLDEVSGSAGLSAFADFVALNNEGEFYAENTTADFVSE